MLIEMRESRPNSMLLLVWGMIKRLMVSRLKHSIDSCIFVWVPFDRKNSSRYSVAVVVLVLALMRKRSTRPVSSSRQSPVCGLTWKAT